VTTSPHRYGDARSDYSELSGLDFRLLLDSLPDATTVSTAVRDEQGRAVDMTLDYLNAAARAAHPDSARAIGTLCSELWPQMVRNGSFAACLRVLDSGESESGEFRWTEDVTYRTGGYDYHAVRVGPDTLLWVLRDSSVRLRRADLLSEASRLASATLEPQEVLEAIAGLVVAELADWCAVHAAGPAAPDRVVLRCDPCSTAASTSDEVAARVLRDAVPVLAPVVLPDAAANRRAHRGGGALGVPLTSRGRTLGVLTMGREAGGAPFGHADLELAADLASRAAVLLDNAQRFQREHRTAEVLQCSLLPVLPPLEEAEVAARYVPGGVDAEVGGDWYDVIDLGAGRIALVIGDVMGRGVQAAAVMGQLRAAVRGYAQLELPPGQVLTLLDRLVDQLDGNQLVTCLYGIYDPANRRLDLANAGHFAPILLGPGTEATYAAVPPAPPLGSGVPEYEEHGNVLAPGAVVALFTDGLVEVRGADIDDRLEELCTLLAGLGTRPLEAMADEVLHHMGRSRRADDDTALLLLRTDADTAPPQSTAPVDAVLADELTAVRRARDLVRAAAGALGLSADGLDVACLLVSELVTNALVHGSAPVVLRVRSSRRRLYIEVADAARYQPHRRVARVTDEDGRGLELLAAMSRRWGVRPQLAGKVVWAEHDL
jgi:serine phosphatase RsbU (regulator of sigma subunit)/anti-sigma regulatory factor (Ser/Thr protein kinase)